MKKTLKHINSKNIWILSVLILLGFLYSCASRHAVAPKEYIPENVERILVLPFVNMTRLYGEMESVKSPLGENYYLTGKAELNSENILTEELFDLLEKRSKYEMLTKNQLPKETMDKLTHPKEGVPELPYLLDIGRSANVDGVFVGYIYRFRERVGNTMSVSSAASVIYELHFIDIKNADLAWSGYFAETQKSLSEDLLGVKKYFQRGGKWITAQEMAVAGLAELLDEFK